MKPEETIDFPIRKVWSRISRIYNTEAAKYGGSMAVGQILLNIEPEGTPSTKLGPKMGMEARSLVRTLQTMEEDGLIKRIADKKALRTVSRNTVIQFNQAVQSRFTPEQMNNFRQVMSELDHILEHEQLF